MSIRFTALAVAAAFVLGLAIGAALLGWSQHRGPIAAADVRFQQGQLDAGIAEATPVSPRELQAELADAGVPVPKNLRQLGAHADSFTTGTFSEHDSTAGTFEPLRPCPGPLSAAQEPLPFRWHDGDRFTLEVPDVRGAPDSATFTADQRYRLTIVGLARDGSPLKQEQVTLQEIDRAGTVLTTAKVEDLRYDYLPAPAPLAWHVELLAGVNLMGLSQPLAPLGGPLAYGAEVQHRVGPLWLGGWALSSGVGGVGVGVEW